jgi:hypothetical protein
MKKDAAMKRFIGLNALRLCVLVALPAIANQPATSSQPKHPLAGTWQANISRSQRHPNHLFKSATLRFEVSDEVVSLTYTGVNMSGAEEKGIFDIHPDGKEHPIPGAPGLVEMSRWISPRVLDTVATKDGKVVGHSSYEVSDDGKTLTARISGSDASGAEFEQIIVCEREQK